MSEVVDVAIVGYGPVGQALTVALAQQGYRVVVVDRWRELYPLPRAVSYDHEVARILQSLGVAEAMRQHTCTGKTYEWRNGQGQNLKVFRGLDQMGVSGWPDKVGFYQPQLEALLDARVRSFRAQVDVLQGWLAESAVQEGENVRLELRSLDGGDALTRTVRARFVVGCDGANSMVRGAMGVSYEDLGFSADWLVVDLKPKDLKDWTGDIVQVCDPARPTTMVPSGPGRRRLEFMLLPGETLDGMNNAASAWRLLAPHGWTPDTAVLERHAVYTFRGCIARQWRVGRMTLAGDAAHLTPPFAAQGLCAGIRDVAALSWRLHQVLQGQADLSLLDSYAEERSGHVRRFIDFAIELGRVICVLDPAQAAGRDAYFLSAQAAGEEDRYPDTRLPPSGMLRADDPHAGALALQSVVEVRGRVGRFDDLVGGGFVLLSLDADVAQQLDESQRRFLQALGARIVVIGDRSETVDLDGAYLNWFNTLGCRTVLIRPDFYLYGAGDVATLVRSLQACGVWRKGRVGDAAVSGSQAALLQHFQTQQDAYVSPPVLKSWLESGRSDVLVLDVRNPGPPLTERIAGAVAMAERDLDQRWTELPKDKLVVLVCWDVWCSLGASAATRLIQRGVRVKELSGGMQAWKSLGFPVIGVSAPVHNPLQTQ
jgi:2-polyprenyl-6-methoxyphenol hydroxylase-like FAD-dependent oxidoreductase/rhodanese-related sulfurtransferase